MRIPSCYFCQLSRVNNRSSAVGPIISRQTIMQIQVMTHRRRRGAFLLQQCMAHAFSRLLRHKPKARWRWHGRTTCLRLPSRPQHSLCWKREPGRCCESKPLCFVFGGLPMKASSGLSHSVMRVLKNGKLELYAANRP